VVFFSKSDSINVPSDHIVLSSIHPGILSLVFLGQSSDLLIKELLSLLPDASIGPIVQGKKAGQESSAEHLRTLTGEERGQVINADHAERRSVGFGKVYGNSGLVECGGDVVDGDRVVRVGAVDH
jgi:hypothetical protein